MKSHKAKVGTALSILCLCILFVLYYQSCHSSREATGMDTLLVLHNELVRREIALDSKNKTVQRTVELDTIPMDESFIESLSVKPDTEIVQQYQYRLKTIYGVDNRKDISCFEITDRSSFLTSTVQVIKSARTVCALIPKALLKNQGNGFFLLDSKTLMETRFKDTKPCSVDENMCFNELVYNDNIKYAEQLTGPCCTGFGYRNNEIVTAKHCYDNGKSFQDFYYVFGFAYFTAEHYNLIPEKDVFEAVGFSGTSSYEFRKVRLNRNLGPEQKVVVESEDIQDNQTIYTIGHPDGLPMKITLDGKASATQANVPGFFSNLDTFKGNSGSPVFNTNGRVVGMLIRGDKDYEKIRYGSCFQYYKKIGGFGEEIQKISYIH